MVIVGPEEFKRKTVIVKDLEKREQVEISPYNILEHFKRAMNLC